MEDKPEFKSALQVSEGVEKPPIINEAAVRHFKKRRKPRPSVNEYVEGILAGNRTLLSQAITLVESSLPAHQEEADQIIEKCLPFSGKSIRIGITGVPGVGKSTFIESLGLKITGTARKLAVLAIDPSSELSKGSILGDKTRMEKLSVDPNAYIRPSPSAGTLGGVARKTREIIILCEAAGFNTIFIETVGVGQSETAVNSMVDFFLLLMLAGAGDELQGIKRGIMEMADAIAITKADGNNIDKAFLAKSEYQNALHLYPSSESGWIPQVLTCSAKSGNGIDDIWQAIQDYESFTRNSGFFAKRRQKQAKYWMYEAIDEALKSNFYNRPDIATKLARFEQKVQDGKVNSFTAAKRIIEEYLVELTDDSEYSQP
jgi:LAO/AO transport system kinase